LQHWGLIYELHNEYSTSFSREGAVERARNDVVSVASTCHVYGFSKDKPDSVVANWQQALDTFDNSGQKMAIIQQYVLAQQAVLEQRLNASAK